MKVLLIIIKVGEYPQPPNHETYMGALFYLIQVRNTLILKKVHIQWQNSQPIEETLRIWYQFDKQKTTIDALVKYKEATKNRSYEHNFESTIESSIISVVYHHEFFTTAKPLQVME